MKQSLISKILLHIVIVVCGYSILHYSNFFQAVPTNTNLLNWDAIYHQSIMAEGYQYVAFAQCNLAFFPLFPLLWKITHLSALGISILNALIFLTAYLLLVWEEKLSTIPLLLIISIPSFIFFALPYSESLFFVFAALLIIGYKKDNRFLRNLGFFGASLVKSASIIFIPAIIICEFLSYITYKSKSRVKKDIIYNSISSLMGMFVATGIQAFQTGKWFYFIEIQKYWERQWIIPEIPLYTPVAYDGIAFIIGAIAIYLCAKWFLNIILNKWNDNELRVISNRAVVFSTLYLAATTFLDTFFTYNNGGANLWSLNRHLFCTPFAVVFIIWLFRDFIPSKTDIIIFSLLLFFGIYVSGVYHNSQMTLCYFLFFTSFISLKYYPKITNYLIIIYIFNVIIQLQFYHNFLLNRWIG